MALKQEEKDILYYIAGWVLKGVRDHSSVCDTCVGSVRASAPNNHDCSALVSEKDYTGSSLIHVSSEFFQIILGAEIRFQATDLSTKGIHKKLVHDHLSQHQTSDIPKCHDILRKALVKYFRFRLKSHCLAQMKKEKEEKLRSRKIGSDKSSKSIAMRTSAEFMR